MLITVSLCRNDDVSSALTYQVVAEKHHVHYPLLLPLSKGVRSHTGIKHCTLTLNAHFSDEVYINLNYE